MPNWNDPDDIRRWIDTLDKDKRPVQGPAPRPADYQPPAKPGALGDWRTPAGELEWRRRESLPQQPQPPRPPTPPKPPAPPVVPDILRERMTTQQRRPQDSPYAPQIQQRTQQMQRPADDFATQLDALRQQRPSMPSMPSTPPTLPWRREQPPTADILRERELPQRPASPYQFQIDESRLETGDDIPVYRQWQMQRASGQQPPDLNGGMIARPPIQTYEEFEAGREADQQQMQRQANIQRQEEAQQQETLQQRSSELIGQYDSDWLRPVWGDLADSPALTYYQSRTNQRAAENEARAQLGTQSWYDPIMTAAGNIVDATFFVPGKVLTAADTNPLSDLMAAGTRLSVGQPITPPDPNRPRGMTPAQVYAPIGGALNKMFNPFNPNKFDLTSLPHEAVGPKVFAQAQQYIWSEWQKNQALNEAIAALPAEQQRDSQLAILNSTSGADYAWRTLTAIQQKQNVEQLKQTAQQLAAQGDRTAASAMHQTALELEAASYADLVDQNQNIWAEIVEGVFADPMSLLLDPIVGAGIDAWRAGRAASRVAKASTASTAALDEAVQAGIRMAGQLEEGATVPTAKNWIQQLFGRTAETRAHMESDALWKTATQLFRGVDNAADAKLLLQTWIDNPAQLIRGVEGLQSPALRAVAGVADNKVRYGYLAVAGDEQLTALPVLQSIKTKLLDLPALTAEGRFNPLELLVQMDEAIYRGVRQKYGLAALDLENIGEGVSRWAIRRLDDPAPNGEKWVVDFLNQDGGIMRTTDAMSYDVAKKQTNDLQKALDAGKKTPTVQGAIKMIGNVQRGFLSDMWLNLRPSHWIRNAAAATAAMMADDVYSLRATATILDDLGAKFIGSAPTTRIQETLSGAGKMAGGQAGQTATPDQRHWSRAIWDKNNPYAAVNEAASQVWAGMTHLFGTNIPFGEQAFYLRAFEKGFGRTFNRVWGGVVESALTPQIQQLGLDPRLGKSIIDSVTSAGIYGSKADVATAARKAIYGAYQAFDPRTLGIPDELLTAQGWKAVQNGIEEWLQSSPTPAATMNQVEGYVRRIIGDEKVRYANILREAAPQPGIYEWSKLDDVDQVAEMMDSLAEAARKAGVDPAQAQSQAQQLATRLIDGQQQALDAFLAEVRTTDNPAAMNVAFDLLATLHALKTAARREVDALGRLAADAGTNEMWIKKWQDTGTIYTRLSNELESTITGAADDLRTALAGGEVSRRYDWWDSLRRYFDYDEAAAAELRTTPLGSTKDSRELWEAAIDANRQYLDASMVQLYDSFRRYPSVDALDVLRSAQKQIDIEGAKVAAWLSGLRENALAGTVKWDDYFAARNRAWYAAFDNMAIYNEAAKRAIIAEGMAAEVPTGLRWVDDFAGGEFFLIGPSKKKEGYWIARRLDDNSIHTFDTPGRDPKQATPLVPQTVIDDWKVVSNQASRMTPILDEIAQANPLPTRKPTGNLTLDTVPENADAFVDYADNWRTPATPDELRRMVDPANDVDFGQRSSYRPPDEPTAPQPQPTGPQPQTPTTGADATPITDPVQEVDPNALLTRPPNWESTQRAQALVEGIQVRHKKTGALYTVQKRSDSGGYYWVTDADGKNKRFKSNSIEAVGPRQTPAEPRTPMPDIDQVWDEAEPLKYDATTPRLPETGGPDFLADTPKETVENLYEIIRSMWGKRKQPEVGDIAVHMIATLDDAADRIIAALPELAQRQPNTLDAGQKRFLLQAIDNLLPVFDNTVAESRRVGEGLANAAMLNYQDRRGFDTLLSLISPYHYFQTRGSMAWARRLMTQPKTMNLVYEANRAIHNETQNNDLPVRLQSSVPLLQVPGGVIRMSNPLNWLLPQPINNFVDPDEANNDLERMIMRFQQVLPGLMPVNQLAIDTYFDHVSPLPGGRKRVETSPRRYIPMLGVASDAWQALTGEGLPGGGFDYDPYLARRAAAFMAEEGQLDPNSARYAQQIANNLEQGIDRYANIPPEAQASADAAYKAAQQRSGRDRLLTSATGLFASVPMYNYSDAEKRIRQNQQQYTAAGYDPITNPYGSKADKTAVLQEHPGLTVYWSRNTREGDLQPGQRVRVDEMHRRLETEAYGPMTAAVIAALTDNPNLTPKELNAIKRPYWDAVSAIREQYADLPAAGSATTNGMNDAERAMYELQNILQVPGKPPYPGQDADPQTLQAYYTQLAAYDQQRLDMIERRLNAVLQTPTSMSDQVRSNVPGWKVMLGALTTGQYASELVRQYDDLSHAPDIEKDWSDRTSLQQEAQSAQINASNAAIAQRFGDQMVADIRTYYAADDVTKEAMRQDPNLRTALVASRYPAQYDQAAAMFGPQAWTDYYSPDKPQYPTSPQPTEAEMNAYYAQLDQWNRQHPADAEFKLWLNGLYTRGEQLPEGTYYPYDFGKDHAEAVRIFGENIFDIERRKNAMDWAAFKKQYPQETQLLFGYWNWQKEMRKRELQPLPADANTQPTLTPGQYTGPRPVGSNRLPIGADPLNRAGTPTSASNTVAQQNILATPTTPTSATPAQTASQSGMPQTAAEWANYGRTPSPNAARIATVGRAFGQDVDAKYQQYLNLPADSDERRAFKAANPELRAVQLYVYEPQIYSQLVSQFGMDAVAAWAFTPPYVEDDFFGQKVRSEFVDRNPAGWQVGAWLNGRPNPTGQTDDEFSYNAGADYATARQMFGEDIWPSVMKYRALPAGDKRGYGDRDRVLEFYDWWYELMPDTNQYNPLNYRSPESFVQRGRSYGGGGGWGGGGWGGGGGGRTWVPRVDPRYMNSNLWKSPDYPWRKENFDWSWTRAGDRLRPDDLRAWRPRRN